MICSRNYRLDESESKHSFQFSDDTTLGRVEIRVKEIAEVIACNSTCIIEAMALDKLVVAIGDGIYSNKDICPIIGANLALLEPSLNTPINHAGRDRFLHELFLEDRY